MNIPFVSNISYVLPRKLSFVGATSIEAKPDLFEKESEYITDVKIYEKAGVLKKPVFASIYKSGTQGFEKYTMVRDGKILGDIDIKIDEPDIFVANVEAYKRHAYSGIGTALMQIAVEKSLQSGHSHHATLNAQKLHFVQTHPVGFYEKLGFKEQVATDEEVNTFGIPMDLSVTQNGFWMERVKNNPILK